MIESSFTEKREDFFNEMENLIKKYDPTLDELFDCFCSFMAFCAVKSEDVGGCFVRIAKKFAYHVETFERKKESRSGEKK